MQSKILNVSDYPDYDNHEKVYEFQDVKSGLHAIIAIHNSNLGPALGGCRMWPYARREEAIRDVLRLSKGMTYKSALAKLPLGGGKAVIIGDPRKVKTRDLLLAMGSFVDSLRGDYITAKDSGTSVDDLYIMGERTPYVSGLASRNEHGGDPSPTTAYGTFIGLKAAVKYRLGVDNLTGIKVAIQGVGNVGYDLGKYLVNEGATLYVSDIHDENVTKAVEQLGANAVPPNEIHATNADVFSPCAMGGAINTKTIDAIKARVIAGAANNQLEHPELANELHQKGVLYAPDFVINAGGIIDICYQYFGKDYSEMSNHVDSTAVTLNEIFQRSRQSNCSTSIVANQIAEELFLDQNNQALSMSL